MALAAWLALCALGDVVGQLGQGLGLANRHAGGQARPVEDALS